MNATIHTGKHAETQSNTLDISTSNTSSDITTVMDGAPSLEVAKNSTRNNIPPYLQGLTDEQAFASMSDGPTLVLAGAGTGKTKTLTSAVARRIAQGVPAERILVLTFTNKAARGMKDRVSSLIGIEPPWMGTFHSMCCRILRRFHDYAYLDRDFRIFDADDSANLLKEIIKDEKKGYKDIFGLDEVRSLLQAIDNYKDWLCPPEDASEKCEKIISNMQKMRLNVSPHYMINAISIYKEYQKKLCQANAVDFSDLISVTLQIIKDNKRVYDILSEEWDAVLVDEFQDVNYSQYCLIKLLASKSNQVFVVGDDDQSIYGFRNAHVWFIRNFAEDFPDTTTVRLEENFRSTKNIISAANAVIENDSDRLGKCLYTSNKRGDQIKIVEAYESSEEAEYVVNEIERARLAGRSYQDMAILYRSNYISRFIEKALMKYKIPYKLIGDASFWQRSEIKNILALLALSEWKDKKQSDVDFVRSIDFLVHGFGKKKVVELATISEKRDISLFQAARIIKLGPKTREKMDLFLDTIESVSSQNYENYADRALELFTRTGYKEILSDNPDKKNEDKIKKLNNINEFIPELSDFSSIQELFEYISLMAESKRAEDNAVHLMTIHRSKGLEYSSVFLVAFEDGIMPNARAINEDNLNEETRLAYVAMTRAKEELTISHSKYRFNGGDYNCMRPSMYISDIPKEVIDVHKIKSQRYTYNRSYDASDHLPEIFLD